MSAEFRDVELQIPQELNGLRLDSALARMLPQHSRTRIKGWIEAGRVQISGLSCKPRDVVSAGARVRVHLSAAGPSTTKLRVVHDDFEGPTATYTGSVEGWPLMMSSLKSLLETGTALPSP